MRQARSLFVPALGILLVGCFEHRSQDPDECFELLWGVRPDTNVKVLRAQYWQSPHFTKEYICYFEFAPNQAWRDGFIEVNGFMTMNEPWDLPSDAPDWFKPDSTMVVWSKYDEFVPGLLFEDTVRHHLLWYEIQL